MKSQEMPKITNLKNTYKVSIPKKQLLIIRKRGWFPFLLKSDFAKTTSYLVGKVMGDGHLDSRFTTKFIGYETDLLKLRDLIQHTFSLESQSFSLYHRTNNIGESYVLQVNDSLFGRMLFISGAPQGKKTKIRFNMPKWVKSSDNLLRSFLQGIFEDELSTIKIKRERYIQEATFRMAKDANLQKELRAFLQEIKDSTERFGIECSSISNPYLENIKSDGNTYSQCFRILGNKKNIKIFKERIGFKINQIKIEELEKCMKLIG